MQIIYRRVQNFSRSRQGQRPEAIVIHMTEDEAEDAVEKFNNPLLRNSAHYLITRQGKIWRLVEETDTAWHAGGMQKPTWILIKQDVNPNLYTIGIAHEGRAGEEWTAEMYAASAQLIANISARWDIPIDRRHIIGHSEINSLHSDPGLAVDYQRLLSEADAMQSDSANSIVDQETRTEANLRNRLSTLQLSINAVETENKKLRTEMSTNSAEKTEQLQNQNLGLAEELYQVQQELNDLRSKHETLERKYDELCGQRVVYLAQFSTSELLSAIIKRIRLKR